MSDEDRDYLYDRAEAELTAAQIAGHPGAVRAHYLLAGYYLDRLYGSPDSIPSLPGEAAEPLEPPAMPAPF